MNYNELLLAISDMLDTKLKSELQPIKNDIQMIKNKIQNLENRMQSLEDRMQVLEEEIRIIKEEIHIIKEDIQILKNEVQQIRECQENVILPRLNTIESCYLDTYRRYLNDAERMEAAFEDIDLLKKVVSEHSQKLAALV